MLDVPRDELKLKSTANKRRSNLWNYYTKKPNSDKTAICIFCNQERSYKTSVSNLGKHLRKKHAKHFEGKKIRTELKTVQNQFDSPPFDKRSQTLKMRLSYLWKFYTKKEKSNMVAICKFCHEERSYRSTTTNLKKHLFAKHLNQIDLDDINNKLDAPLQQFETSTTDIELETSRQQFESSGNSDLKSLQQQFETSLIEPLPTTDSYIIEIAPSWGDPSGKHNVVLESESVNRGRTSTIWNYFSIKDKTNGIAICDACNQELSFKSTISNLRKHLTRKHSFSKKDEVIIDLTDQLQFPTSPSRFRSRSPQRLSSSTPKTVRPKQLYSSTPKTVRLSRQEPENVVRGHSRSSSENREFREATKRDAQLHLRKELERLLNTSTGSRKEEIRKEFEGFQELFTRFLNEDSSVKWEKIEKLPQGAVKDYQNLPIPNTEIIQKMLQKLVVVKLNGGLGTSMGCSGPKSIITVRNELTFLDLTVQQIEEINKKYKVNVPLVLMNSFNTDEDTEKVIRKYKNINIEIHTFNQSCYPRINRETLLPIAKSCNIEDNLESWYPPGHGDFYNSFKNSGFLRQFIDSGREYCFISNIDNLGATVDLQILNLLLNPTESAHEFVMEVTDKTRADVKGGTLMHYENKLRLLEIAQVPKEHVDDFKSIKTFKYFNTNNIWARLDAIDRVLSDGNLNMEIIINDKSVGGVNVIQLETAVGAAMKCFENAIGINVPRSRFLPVKKTSDLLLVMSNLYSLKFGSLVMSPERMFPTTPLVKLGDPNFSRVKDFHGRFANIPDIIELDHLTVSGDVTFGRGISLRGTVIIIANHGDRIDIPSGTILENKIVSGNLRILDH